MKMFAKTWGNLEAEKLVPGLGKLVLQVHILLP
jgi:hypothetical protein